MQLEEHVGCSTADETVGVMQGPAAGREATLSTCCDERIEGDSVGNAALLMHFIEELQGQLPLASLFTGANQAAVGDDTALAALPDHLLKDLHHLYTALPVNTHAGMGNRIMYDLAINLKIALGGAMLDVTSQAQAELMAVIHNFK